jgi:hypothetical protein
MLAMAVGVGVLLSGLLYWRHRGPQAPTEIFMGILYGSKRLVPTEEGSGLLHWARIDLTAPGMESRAEGGPQNNAARAHPARDRPFRSHRTPRMPLESFAGVRRSRGAFYLSDNPVNIVSCARPAITHKSRNHWWPQTTRAGLSPQAQAIFCRRRHQPRRPPLAKIRPGSPAPAIGPGAADGASPAGGSSQ